ncbi:DUF4426 domain-containing protein [Luteimonas lutimaris]|uniref:DUF4426 domain-containing protein n=1 Tax=Luteimonas lutimaris TaxID=698645 RepID=A0ABP7N190_9GAMM
MTDGLARAASALVLVAALAGCGASPPPSAHQAQAPEEAMTRVGDVLVRANVLPTTIIGEAVATQYGVERDPGTVMLLVGVRRDADGGETALPARVTATAADLLGKRQQLQMREVRSGEFIDYVGTARVIAPDTLRFVVTATPEGGSPMELRFNRDFFPR